MNPWHALLLRPVRAGDGIASDQFLTGVEPEFVKQIGDAGRTQVLAAGEVLYREGDPAADLAVVGQGAVTLSMRTGPDRAVPIAVLGPSSIFGSTALLGGGGVRDATATAAVRTVVSLYDAQLVTRLLDEHPKASAAVRSALVHQVLELSARVVESLHLPAPDLIRRRLVALAAAHPGGRVPITQQQLAELTGTSRATVNALLAREVRDGHVVVHRAAIEILDVAGLAGQKAGQKASRVVPESS